uniref:MAPK regulated corepressor interacting protein 2 n=1 Tax=Monopterus albus TaxID=43700 RepID=A0A3Q3J014_MONAL
MMYTITRGPSKLVTQRRTGETNLLTPRASYDMFSLSLFPISLPAPKIVFNRLNSKKYQHPAAALPADNQWEESFTPAHEENVKFVYEAWQEVLQQEQGPSQGRDEPQRAVHYKETTPSPHINDFVPIDLDEWWAQRFLANIDKLS